jgi:hypothetical protein
MLCEESINIKLICGQEGHTGVVELEPASHDDEAVAEDDPEAVRLMIDFRFFLSRRLRSRRHHETFVHESSR